MDRFFGLDRASNQGENVSLLTTVHDDVEKKLLCGILEEEGIPYLLKDRGSGGAMRILSGFSMFASDIFVPTALLDKAQELLEVYRNGEIVEEDAEGESEADE